MGQVFQSSGAEELETCNTYPRHNGERLEEVLLSLQFHFQQKQVSLCEVSVCLNAGIRFDFQILDKLRNAWFVIST